MSVVFSVVFVVMIAMTVRHCLAGTRFPGGGIPVPGRSVAPLDILRLYVNACHLDRDKTQMLDNLFHALAGNEAEQIASTVYNELYFSVADVDPNKLMGKWITVFDSSPAHRGMCSVSFYQLLSSSQYTATFSIVNDWRSEEGVTSAVGYGRMLGSDPGSLLIFTSSNKCPYSIVRLGPVGKGNLYDYMILSQPLKQPTMVLTRDVWHFEQKYRPEVVDFLQRYRFWNAASPMNPVNTTLCLQTAHDRFP